jgi:hypothetical protein
MEEIKTITLVRPVKLDEQEITELTLAEPTAGQIETALRRAEDGWVWKFDSEAMGSRRFGEPVREYLQAVGCRAVLIFGEKSALVSRETASTCRP